MFAKGDEGGNVPILTLTELFFYTAAHPKYDLPLETQQLGFCGCTRLATKISRGSIQARRTIILRQDLWTPTSVYVSSKKFAKERTLSGTTALNSND